MSDTESKGDEKAVQKWIKVYDKAWKDYKKLPSKFHSLATLYTQEYERHLANNAYKKVNQLRKK